MTQGRFGWFALVLAVALALPALASAQDEADEKDAAEGAADTEVPTDEKPADDATASGAVSADVLGASPISAETETPPAAEEERAEEQAPEPPKSSPVTGTWTKKIEFASEDGNFRFQPTGFIQPKLQLLITTADGVDDKLAGSGFVLHRARFGFKAALFKFARMEVVGDFKSGAFGLVDAYGDVDPWEGVFAVRAGRFRPWMGRQFMAGSTQLQMIENANAWADTALGLGLDRDLGVGVFGLVKDAFEYGIGVWNGDGGSIFDAKARELKDSKGKATVGADGAAVTAPGNIDVMIGGRLAVHPLAPFGVGRPLPLGNESDSDISEKPALALGVSAYFNKRHDRLAENVACAAGLCADPAQTEFDALYYDNQLKLGVDLGFQMIGLSFAGEFFMLKVWLPDDADPTVEQAVAGAADTGVSTVDGIGMGMYAQVGYFAIPKKLEIAARFDMVDPSAGTDGVRGNRMYPGLGATYHFFGNNLKLQLMYRLDIAAGFEDTDPGYMATGHDLFLMLQASI